MRQRLIATAIFAACFGWFAATSAHGQYSRRATISRPSAGPSSRIGRLGGVYTRQYGVGSMGGGRVRGLPPPRFFGAAGQLGGLLPTPMPQALTFAQVGYSAGRSTSARFGLLGGVSSSQLASVSGLRASQSLSVPLTGRRLHYLRLPPRPYYVPEPEANALHAFFDLTPTRAESASQTPIPVGGLVGLLEQENEQLLHDLRSRALWTFKRATTADVEDRAELLSAAQRQLTTMRDLELQEFTPCLLLVHTALEKEQILQATRHLADAAQRYPSVFIERPDIASYYGDAEWLEDKQQWRSELLELQMRKHLRIGDENPGMPSAYVLQAYCAWVLNDRTRVKYALDQMMAAEQDAAVRAEIIGIRYALAAAMK